MLRHKAHRISKLECWHVHCVRVWHRLKMAPVLCVGKYWGYRPGPGPGDVRAAPQRPERASRHRNTLTPDVLSPHSQLGNMRLGRLGKLWVSLIGKMKKGGKDWLFNFIWLDLQLRLGTILAHNNTARVMSRPRGRGHCAGHWYWVMAILGAGCHP